MVKLMLEPTIKDSDSVIDRWLQKISVNKSSASSASHYKHLHTASHNCKKRDNKKCILTGWTDPDAAHIYPLCLLKASTREPRAAGGFWDVMNLFWERSRVEQWQKEIFGDETRSQNPRDGCWNMLSLAKSAHALWGAGKFALRPIFTDSKTVKVEFHWQKRCSDGVAELDLLTTPQSSRGLYGEQGSTLPVCIGYGGMGQPLYRGIASSDVFAITTNDPKRLPLPSVPLLEMQWYLQRITGMSGAAEAGEDVEYNDHDADTPALRTAAIRRTRDIHEWLTFLPEREEPSDSQQPVQVYHPTTTL